MKKQQGVVPFLISLFIIGGLYEPVLRFLRYLMHRPFLGLESFTRLPKDQLLMLAVFLFGCILFISSIVKMIRSAPAAKAAAKGPAAKAAAKGPARPQQATRTRETARPATARPAAVKPRPSIRLHAPDQPEAEEAIHCAHLTGRAKYLEQLESFLRTGLIDRNEYRILKERYMNLDIPDDYH